MQTKSLKGFTFLSILLFCSCSDFSETAQVPDMAPVTPVESQPSEVELQPARVLSQHQDLFGSLKTNDSKFAGDSLFEPQESFEETFSDDTLTLEQGDFSQGVIPIAK